MSASDRSPSPRPRSGSPSGGTGRPPNRRGRSRRKLSTGFIALGFALLLLLAGAGAVYAFDSSRSEHIARGVSVAGVDVGGMPMSAARGKLEAEVADPLAKPLKVVAAGRTFRLSARRARVRADVDAMTADALAASRSGNFVSRAWREATGGGESADVPSRISYSKRAVDGLVKRVERTTNRSARDAEVDFSAGGVTKVASRTGRAVRAKALKRRLRAQIDRPAARRTVRASFATTKPKVTKGELAGKYPHMVMVNRSGFRLTYYRRLKKVKSYPIAVGKVGLETPAGLYQIQNKAVNPAWSVPNSDWAGDKAGKLIPGGIAENPLKARWMGIYDGAGIHGTDETESLGTNASHGCIRMSIPEVIELYKRVPVNTPVYIA